MRTDLIVYPSKLVTSELIDGAVHVPGDKSISHRALMLGSIASGTSYIRNMLMGLDCLATLEALRALGIKIEVINNQVVIYGKGVSGFSKFSNLSISNLPNNLSSPSAILIDLGNSGTSMRLLSGLLAGTNLKIILTGDNSLQNRPMKRITQPLRAMGVDIQGVVRGHEEYAPLKFNFNSDFISNVSSNSNFKSKLQNIHYISPIPSAQIKSCLLLAALQVSGVSTIEEPIKSRDHTESMLRAMGVAIQEKGNKLKLAGHQVLKAFENYIIPGDISSAAFLMVAAAISPGAVLTIKQVGVNPTRTGIIDLLKRMGVEILVVNRQILDNEPIADITIIGPDKLMAINVQQQEVVRAIDEFPVFFVAAACAIGKTKIEGIAELRHKESDRVKVMAEALIKLGIRLEIDNAQDSIAITGQPEFVLQVKKIDKKINKEIEINTAGDHRIAMALVIASLKISMPIRLKNTENIATSFPGFIDGVKKLGIMLEEKREKIKEEFG